MPLTHINFSVVSRAQRAGNAVHAAAYQAAARFEHGARVFDFTRKREEYVAGAVLLPAEAPPALRDPQTLWAAAEAAERRSDAQTARQAIVSIPRSVPREQWAALAQAIAETWVADGAACQFDVHCPTAADGGEQPHVHYLLSMRRVSDKGFAPTKAREWNQAFREQDGRAERQRIADRANEFFAAHGISARLDPRSLAAQGDNRPPEPHAERTEWEQWKRQGADPESAPPTVAAVLRHRDHRRKLDTVEAAAAAAGAEVAAIQVEVAAGRPAATNPTRAPKIAGIGVESENPTAVNGRTGRTPEGGATSMPPKTAPRTDPWAECLAGWRADMAAARQAEKAEREADRQSARRTEAAVRESHKARRDHVYKSTRKSLVRDLSLAAAATAAQRDRVRLRADQMSRDLTQQSRTAEPLDDWIRRRAGGGDIAAQEVVGRRERAAARLAARDPAEAARRSAAAAREVAERIVAAAPPDAITIKRRADEALARSQARRDKAAADAKAAQMAIRAHARAHSITGLGWFVIGRKAASEQARLRLEVAQAAKAAAWAAADYQADRQAARKALPVALRQAEQARAEWSKRPEVQGAWQTLAEPLPRPPRPAPADEPPPTDPREAAIARLHAAERQATNPTALAAARLATAAALAGDQATVAAAVTGDLAAARAAAEAWQQAQQAAAREAARLRNLRSKPGVATGYGM